MKCHHKPTSPILCTIYAFSLATAFVANLYILVPKEISTLPRTSLRQIKWRVFSVIVTFSIALATYPYIFYECADGHGYFSISTIVKMTNVHKTTLTPLIHVIILYFGSFVTSLLQMKLAYMKIESRRTSTSAPTPTQSLFILRQISQIARRPFSNPWQASRDLLIAPLAEEIIFRVCIITPFLYSGKIGIGGICWIAPLFFGLAHFHHAIQKLKGGAKWQHVCFETLFQFTYTTLFGAYASYCFIKFGSLVDIVLLHTFCNFMGLPNVSVIFGSPSMKDYRDLQKTLESCRLISIAAYVLGIFAFIMGFRHSVGLFPVGIGALI